MHVIFEGGATPIPLPDTEVVNLWMDELKKELDATVMITIMEFTNNRMEGSLGTISNERIWEKGYHGESPNPHTQNIVTHLAFQDVLKTYSESLMQDLHKRILEEKE